MADANPTDVNPFNGLSDASKTAEVAQSLWDRQSLIDNGQTEGAKPAVAETKATETAPEATAEAAPEAETPEVEAPAYADLDDYLTKAGLERESFLSLPVKLKVDGKDEQATLQELLKAAQLERHVNQRSQQFAAEQKKWETERATARQQAQQQVEQANQLAQLARNQLYGDYQSIDWTQYTAEQQLQIERNFRQRDAQLQQQLAQIQATQQQSIQQQIQTEHAKMLDAIPEWRDQTQLQAGQKAISEYAQAKGFTKAELSSIYDSRYMLVLRDAARVGDLQAQVDTLKAQLAGKVDLAKNRVRQAPQAPSPGARITRDPKVAQLESARDRFRKNPRDVEAQAGLAQRLLDAGA